MIYENRRKMVHSPMKCNNRWYTSTAWLSLRRLLVPILALILEVSHSDGFTIFQKSGGNHASNLPITTLEGTTPNLAPTPGLRSYGTSIGSSSNAASMTVPDSSLLNVNQDETLLSSRSTIEIKDRLVKLATTMMGTAEEFRWVEACVNTLEERYMPALTLDFLNLAMGGDWQLLFSTSNLSRWSKSKQHPASTLAIRNTVQRIDTRKLEGMVINSCTWEDEIMENVNNHNEDNNGKINQGNSDNNSVTNQGTSANVHSRMLTGTFTIKCSYKISQGSRMMLELEDHVLQPARGSMIPPNVPQLVSRLHSTMPKELFDPSEHSMDITYLDENLRIARMTGPRFEGVREIFVRVRSLPEVISSPSSSQGTME